MCQVGLVSSPRLKRLKVMARLGNLATLDQPVPIPVPRMGLHTDRIESSDAGITCCAPSVCHN